MAIYRPPRGALLDFLQDECRQLTHKRDLEGRNVGSRFSAGMLFHSSDALTILNEEARLTFHTTHAYQAALLDDLLRYGHVETEQFRHKYTQEYGPLKEETFEEAIKLVEIMAGSFI